MTLNLDDYRNRLVIADGDFSSELFSRGWRKNLPVEAANLTRADIVRDVADAFLDAGAGVLVTNTARANALAWPNGSGELAEPAIDLAAVNRAGAALARAAVSDPPATGQLVFGAMGPTDRLLTINEVDEDALGAAYRAQAEALGAGGADAILCRSFSELEALCIAVRAAQASTGLPVIGSMTFDSGAEHTETTLGVTAPQACAALTEAGAAMIGCDCGQDPDTVPAVVALMRQATALPIWVQVNAGAPQLREDQVVYGDTPERFAERLDALAAAGANFVGGCCGATVDHIAALAKAHESRRHCS